MRKQLETLKRMPFFLGLLLSTLPVAVWADVPPPRVERDENWISMLDRNANEYYSASFGFYWTDFAFVAIGCALLASLIVCSCPKSLPKNRKIGLGVATALGIVFSLSYVSGLCQDSLCLVAMTAHPLMIVPVLWSWAPLRWWNPLRKCCILCWLVFLLPVLDMSVNALVPSLAEWRKNHCLKCGGELTHPRVYGGFRNCPKCNPPKQERAQRAQKGWREFIKTSDEGAANIDL